MNDNFKGWKNFEEFIDTANSSCNWLVLRNFEYLPNDFFENDKDVDVLCENLEQFVKKMKLTKRSWGVAAYETTIEDKIVPFDVRFLGDRYYDKLWQYKMLKNKIYTVDNIPRMNDEDYFFSLLYHSKLQTYEVKEVYKSRFFILANSLNITDYKIENIKDDKYLAKKLNQYLKLNHYTYTLPLDCNVPKNKYFFDLLDKSIKNDRVFMPPFKIRIKNLFPKWVFKIIPYKVKKIIKKALVWK